MLNDEKVLEMIPVGFENRISSSDLETLLQVNRRDLKACISRLRRNGAIICSTLCLGGGYFKPQSREELAAWLRVERARNRTHKESLQYARKALKNWLV